MSGCTCGWPDSPCLPAPVSDTTLAEAIDWLERIRDRELVLSFGSVTYATALLAALQSVRASDSTLAEALRDLIERGEVVGQWPEKIQQAFERECCEFLGQHGRTLLAALASVCADGNPDGTDAVWLARRFHEVYEELAPTFGYTTRRDSAVPWDEVPRENRHLMIATCAVLLRESPALASAGQDDPPAAEEEI
jgi:hypothetical protein